MSAYLDELYFDWLYGQVCSVRAKNPADTYRNLFHILYTTEFIWIVPNDDNRVEDGKALRHEFLEDEHLNLAPSDEFWLDLGCSFLELLVGLSRRLSFIADGTEAGWFWEMIENLGLEVLDDRVSIDRNVVDDILSTVIWRTYDRDGRGGLFPLKSANRDQTKVELWYQLSAYILERS